VPNSIHRHGGKQHIANDLTKNREKKTEVRGNKEMDNGQLTIDNEKKKEVSGKKIVNSEKKEKTAGHSSGVSQKEHRNHHHHQLDYIHLRILNHPWNNKKIIEMIFVQAIFFLILSSLLFVKNFK
jgi:uncharacterized cupredoxin-like copper-binding protein